MGGQREIWITVILKPLPSPSTTSEICHSKATERIPWMVGMMMLTAPLPLSLCLLPIACPLSLSQPTYYNCHEEKLSLIFAWTKGYETEGEYRKEYWKGKHNISRCVWRWLTHEILFCSLGIKDKISMFLCTVRVYIWLKFVLRCLQP